MNVSPSDIDPWLGRRGIPKPSITLGDLVTHEPDELEQLRRAVTAAKSKGLIGGKLAKQYRSIVLEARRKGLIKQEDS